MTEMLLVLFSGGTGRLLDGGQRSGRPLVDLDEQRRSVQRQLQLLAQRRRRSRQVNIILFVVVFCCCCQNSGITVLNGVLPRK